MARWVSATVILVMRSWLDLDAIIVGSGIHRAAEPVAAAKAYAEASWQALLERSGA